MGVRLIFRCDFCDRAPDAATQLSLERMLRELAFGEYLEVTPGHWLAWLGGGPLGQVDRTGPVPQDVDLHPAGSIWGRRRLSLDQSRGDPGPDRVELALQVPDGTDWIEYMLNQPEHADLRLTGVMNHISLGVVDMKKAQAILESHGWKPHGEEEAKLGKDGKWQLNLYDPDLVRVELMEFKPAQKPCCSDFTGPHPSE